MLSSVVNVLHSTRAEAQTVCGTLSECRTRESQTHATLAQTQATLGRIQARIRELQDSSPVALGDILRDSNGRVRHTNLRDADGACRDQGGRLPTARELAVYSQSLGAQGIRETAHPGVGSFASKVQAEIAQMNRDGYYPNYYVANNSGDKAIDFYFNSSGYQRPAGDLGDYWFWSSSVLTSDFGYDYDSAYVLNGFSGYFTSVVRSEVSAIREIGRAHV